MLSLPLNPDGNGPLPRLLTVSLPENIRASLTSSDISSHHPVAYRGPVFTASLPTVTAQGLLHGAVHAICHNTLPVMSKRAAFAYTAEDIAFLKSHTLNELIASLPAETGLSFKSVVIKFLATVAQYYVSNLIVAANSIPDHPENSHSQKSSSIAPVAHHADALRYSDHAHPKAKAEAGHGGLVVERIVGKHRGLVIERIEDQHGSFVVEKIDNLGHSAPDLRPLEYGEVQDGKEEAHFGLHATSESDVVGKFVKKGLKKVLLKPLMEGIDSHLHERIVREIQSNVSRPNVEADELAENMLRDFKVAAKTTGLALKLSQADGPGESADIVFKELKDYVIDQGIKGGLAHIATKEVAARLALGVSAFVLGVFESPLLETGLLDSPALPAGTTTPPPVSTMPFLRAASDGPVLEPENPGNVRAEEFTHSGCVVS